MDLKVARKYRLGEKIVGECEVFEGVNVLTGEKVVIKLEPLKHRHHSLVSESKIYRALTGTYGTAKLKWFGQEGCYYAMVLERLGPSLQDLFEYCREKFSLKTVLMLARQMLDRLEMVHSKHLLHRGVKPANFVMGKGEDKGTCYIIDFGLSQYYFSNRTGHKRYSESRRDDMESLGYTLMYFLRGSLPWERSELERSSRCTSMDNFRQRILKSKQEMTTALLCQGFPKEFQDFFTYVRSLLFEERPDYAYLRRMFRELFDRKGFQDDGVYDWDALRQAHSQKIPNTEAPASQPAVASKPAERKIGDEGSKEEGPMTRSRAAALKRKRSGDAEKAESPK